MVRNPENEIVRRTLDTDAGEPAVQVAETVADIQGSETTELATMYDCVDHVLDHLFSVPPAPEAQMEITFSYEEFRITVCQDGTAEFVKTNA